MSMKKARAAFIEQFSSDLNEIIPNTKNVEFYNSYLTSLSDEKFLELVETLEAGLLILPIFTANLDKSESLDLQRNLAIGKAWGHEFFERLKLTDLDDPELVYTTPIKYLVIDATLRRQSQTLESGRGISKSNDSVDDLTGQVTGKSKGSGMTPTEIQILNAKDLGPVIKEYVKHRGGDQASYNELEAAIINSGSGTLAESSVPGSRPKSTETLSTVLTVSHIGNNL